MAFAGHKVALITGASSGLGREFALQLTKKGVAVVLVARRADKLKDVAGEVEAAGGKAIIVACDLLDRKGRARLSEAMDAHDVDLLVNNAGFGKIGAFADTPAAEAVDMVELNVTALVDLTHAAVTRFRARSFGRVVNLASVAGFVAVPYFAVYAATKTFVRDFSACVDQELKGTGVRVHSICPGPTETEFFDVAGASRHMKAAMMRADTAVRLALEGVERGDAEVVLGLRNKVVTASASVLPRSVSMKVAEFAMKAR